MTAPQLNEHDKYALRRVMTRKPVPEGLQLSPLIELLMKAYNSGDQTEWSNLFDVTTRLYSQMDAMTQQEIFKLDPNAPAPEIEQPGAEVFIPKLPREAQLTEEALKAAESVGGWYRDTVQWCADRSPMTPKHFLEVGVIWLIGLAVARRVYIELHERIYPHLYVLLVAETSKYAKSTGMNTIYSLALATIPHMLIPGQTTPEGLIELLSGEKPANYDKLPEHVKKLVEAGRKFSGQRGIVMDEYSGLLASSKKDYMAGFLELLMRLYDARESEQHYTRSGGYININNPAICILGATTPAAMGRALSGEDWENGAMARYLTMFRDEPLPFTNKRSIYSPPKEILKVLKFLHINLPDVKDDFNQELVDFKALSAEIQPDALKQYEAYDKAVRHDLIDEGLDQRLHGNYTRMHLQAMKIALAVACMDWAAAGGHGKPIITLGHWALGQQMAEKARESLHRMMPVLSESRDSRTQRDLLTLLRQYPSGLTIRDICRQLHRKTSDIHSAVQIMVDSGEVEIIQQIAANNHPIKIYKSASPQ